jgi:hypothetical protein
MDTEWLNDSRFENIDVRKKEYMARMLSNIQGKSMNEGMRIYTQTMAAMKKEGLALSREEGQLMIEFLMKNMSPAEQQKWNKIKGMIKF